MRAQSRAISSSVRVIITLAALVLPLVISSTGVARADNERVTPFSGLARVSTCTSQPGHFACFALVQPVPTRPSDVTSSGPFTPTDLHDAYQIPYSSTTATIAVVDAFGTPTVASDLAVYRRHFGLPACTVANGCLQIVNQDGGPALPAPETASMGWEDETELDVEMVSAICASCHILLVQADSDYSQDMIAAVNEATSLGAKYVSMSWGSPEQADGVRLNPVPGVVYVAASGDSGYGTNYPAADPSVVSVGGTSLSRTSSGRGWTDTVWNNSMGGTGGGCSSVEAMPSWQQEIPGLQAICPNRSLNDVSIVADPNTGMYIYDQGTWLEGGGTSAGTPMIATMYALADASVAPAAAAVPAPAIPYTHPNDFVDVTQGTSGWCRGSACIATTGYDTPSGLGVPQGVGAFVAGALPAIKLHAPTSAARTSYTGQRVSVKVAGSDQAGARLTYFATGLPAGLTLSPSGIVTGVPQHVGHSTVRVTAVDAQGARGTLAFSWTVAKAKALVPTRKLTISGALLPGHVVKASWGTLRAGSAKGAIVHPTLHVQWYLDGRPVKGATKLTFRLPKTAHGHRLSLTVSASGTGYVGYVHTTVGYQVR